MDRFLMKMSMGHPSMDEEKAIPQRRKLRGKDNYDVEQIVELRRWLRCRRPWRWFTSIQQSLVAFQVVQRTRGPEN